MIKCGPGNLETATSQPLCTIFGPQMPEGMRKHLIASEQMVDRNPHVLLPTTYMMPDLGLIAGQDVHDGPQSSLP